MSGPTWATWSAQSGAARQQATIAANTASAAIATRLRRRRRHAARQGPTPSIGRPSVAATPGTAGLGSKANSAEGSEPRASAPRYFRQKRAQSWVATGQSSPLQFWKFIRSEKNVLCLRVRVDAPVGLLLGVAVQRGPLLLGLRC